MLILKKCNIAEFIRVVSLAVRGEHLNDPLVISCKAKTVKVTAKEEVLVNLDGEYGGKIPAIFENLSRHVEMYVPFDKLRPQDQTWQED